MSYGTWDSNRPRELPQPPITVRGVLAQTFSLLRRGYFKWVAMSLPAYLITMVISILLVKGGHVQVLAPISYNQHTLSAGHYRIVGYGYLVAASLTISVGLVWGQIFPIRSISRSYFAHKTEKSFSRKPSLSSVLPRIGKALLASIIICIIVNICLALFDILIGILAALLAHTSSETITIWIFIGLFLFMLLLPIVVRLCRLYLVRSSPHHSSRCCLLPGSLYL